MMNRRAESGFTLLEVLVAGVLLAVILSLLYSVQRTTLRVVSGSLKQLTAVAAGREALERLGEDLQLLVTGVEGHLLGSTQQLATGRGDGLAFVSAVHLPLRRNDYPLGASLIEYSVEEDAGSGLLNLYRRSTTLLPGRQGLYVGTGTRHLLCAGLREVRLAYLDEAGKSHDSWSSQPTESAAWQSESKEEGRLPLVVAAELRFPAEPTGAAADSLPLRTAFLLPQSDVAVEGRGSR